MKTLFLIPPSEWKNSWWKFTEENLYYKFKKPCDIAKNVKEKDLKASGDRFQEWLNLNISLCEWEQNHFSYSIERYTWVMFNSIDYENMQNFWKKFFEESFLITSGMYWLLKPKDIIWNYKLPIETKWLYDYWWASIADKIIEKNPSCLINLLPISYGKLFWIWQKTKKHILDKFIDNWIKIININFLKNDWKKLSHGVKKIKWEWIKHICENNLSNYQDFWWEEKKIEEGLVDLNFYINS